MDGGFRTILLRAWYHLISYLEVIYNSEETIWFHIK